MLARGQLVNPPYTLGLGSNNLSCMLPQLLPRFVRYEMILLSDIVSSFASPMSTLLSAKQHGQHVFGTIFF